MGFWDFFTTWYFYALYIAGMLSFGIYYYLNIYKRYSNARKSSKEIYRQLTGLQTIPEIGERFNKMNDWIDKQNSPYIKYCVKPSWKAFYNKYMEYQRNGVTITPDVLDYFQEDVFTQQYGKRKFAELVPGLFLAAGIVGTFLGIAVGVSGLSTGGDSQAMKSGIDVLLSGMKVKFISSIIGIILSALWQYRDKVKHLPSLIESFHLIRQGMDETFPTHEESTVLYQMLQNQEKHMLDFQSFMSEQLIPQMMTGFSDALHQSLMPHLDKTQEMMGEMIKNTTANQAEGMKQLADEFVSSLSQITGDHMRDLGEALKTTVEWQKRVHEEMSTLVQSMQDSAREQSLMVEKTTALTEQIHRYTEQVTDYQDVMERTVSQLNETTVKNSELHMAISGLLERMVEERNVFHEHFKEHLQMLQSNVEAIVSQTELQVTVQRQLEQNLLQIASMSESQHSLASSLQEQAIQSIKSGEGLSELVGLFENNITMFTSLQSNMGELLSHTAEERERMDQLAREMQEGLTEQVEQMDARTEALSSLWGSTSDVMTRMNNQLSTSMNQFIDDMHRGLQHTFGQFDQELTKSVKLLASGVDSMRDGLIDMPDIIQDLKQSVVEINKQAKRIASPQ